MGTSSSTKFLNSINLCKFPEKIILIPLKKVLKFVYFLTNPPILILTQIISRLKIIFLPIWRCTIEILTIIRQLRNKCEFPSNEIIMKYSGIFEGGFIQFHFIYFITITKKKKQREDENIE